MQGQQLAEFAEDLRQELSSERISVGISASLGDLCEAYREALLAVNRALALGGHIVVIYSSPENLAAGKDYPQKQQRDLIKSIFELRSEELDGKADIYVDSLLKSCKMNLLNIKLCLQTVPALLTDYCLDNNINSEETLRCDSQQTNQLLELSDIAELRDWLKKTALLYLELIRDSRQKPEHAQIKRVKEYIETHYNEEITVDKAASIACLSASHFRRVFKQECGESFSQYLTAQRIAQAKLLLNNSKRPITEIAFELGFKDSNYFSTVFRKSEGTSPRDYRQNQN